MRGLFSVRDKLPQAVKTWPAGRELRWHEQETVGNSMIWRG
jgi:hypothetical protein